MDKLREARVLIDRAINLINEADEFLCDLESQSKGQSMANSECEHKDDEGTLIHEGLCLHCGHLIEDEKV